MKSFPVTLPPTILHQSSSESFGGYCSSPGSGWEDNTPNCSICGVRLGKRHFNPRHHCRICGRCVCKGCSSHEVQVLGHDKPQRACKDCFGSMEKENPRPRAISGDIVKDSDVVSQMGNSAQVFSVSQNEWLEGQVTGMTKGHVTVIYQMPNGTKVEKKLPKGHQHLRLLETSEPSGMARPQRFGARADAPVSFPKTDNGMANLQGVPFLGVRNLGRIQTDTMRRFERLIVHGDAQGAQRVFARAKLLDVSKDELDAAQKRLKALREEGEFALLLAN